MHHLQWDLECEEFQLIEEKYWFSLSSFFPFFFFFFGGSNFKASEIS